MHEGDVLIRVVVRRTEREDVFEALGEAVAEEAVQALVVVHRTGAEIPEAHHGGDQHQGRVCGDLPVAGREP